MLAAGTVLQDRYRINKVLAQGGMGDIYHATHIRLDLPLAIKRLRQLSSVPEEQKRFEDQFEVEAKLLARLGHPSVARIIDYFYADEHPHLVMEYVAGHTLHEFVERGPQPQLQVLEWNHQLLDCLEYLHSRFPPVIIRDLNPRNIIQRLDGSLCLIDFGISRGLSWGSATQSVVSLMGSPGFAPLEQYGAGHSDQRSDFYGLGATLLCLLTGQVPPDAPARLASHMPLPDAYRLNASVTDKIQHAIQKLMAIEAEDRPSSVDEIRTLFGPPPPRRSPSVPGSSNTPRAGATRPLPGTPGPPS